MKHLYQGRPKAKEKKKLNKLSLILKNILKMKILWPLQGQMSFLWL